MFTAIGLILNIIGVIFISLHSLYDYGLSIINRLWETEEIIRNQTILKNIDDKIKSKAKLTPLEKEQLIQLLKDALSFHVTTILVTIWLGVNKYVFFFHPWVEDKPREVNRFLWNFVGLLLVLVGFIFQLIGSFIK